MMMGTAGELPKPPEQPIQFLEDMTEAQVAEAVRWDIQGTPYIDSGTHDRFLARYPCRLGKLGQHLLYGSSRNSGLCMTMRALKWP